jgi:putative hemolysin
MMELSATPSLEPIALPGDDRLLRQEVSSLAAAGKRILTGTFDLYFFRRDEAPGVVEELGRLREESFRTEGEGTGLARDLDSFDDRYFHLIAWDVSQGKIAGAYRLGFVGEIVATQGPTGLYTDTLFHLAPGFVDANHDAIELGRSFVSVDYRKEPLALHSLWLGLGKVVQLYPETKALFGPVSLSPDHRPTTQNLLIRFLRENRGDPFATQSARARVEYPEVIHGPLGISSLNELQRMIQSTGDREFRLPPLLKHYFRLGGKVLGFNVDPKFRNSVDCLFYLEIAKLDARVLRRYLPNAD